MPAGRASPEVAAETKRRARVRRMGRGVSLTHGMEEAVEQYQRSLSPTGGTAA